MKTIAEFINESKTEKTRTTLGGFYQWAVEGIEPDGKISAHDILADDCATLLDNGWFEYFDDNDPEQADEDIAEFVKANLNAKIVVISKEEHPGQWSVSFDLNGQTYTMGSNLPFGDMNF